VYDRTTLLDTLAGQAHAEGGWAYAPGQAVHLEPTCLALLALSLDGDRFKTAIQQGRAALERCGISDGSYRLPYTREEAVWPTALVLFVQGVLQFPPAHIERTAARLLDLRGRPVDSAHLEGAQDIDLRLEGWPWAEGNFSWVEPTAWACLALRRVGQGGHPRVRDGLRLLLDRALEEGGINYGNRRILGKTTEPIPGPTALMLLALQGHGDEARVAAAVKYLQGQVVHGDLEHLCWAKLALDVHQDQPGCLALLTELDRAILQAAEDRAATNWVRPAPLRQALMALALGTQRDNVFRLQAPPSGGRQPPETARTQGADAPRSEAGRSWKQRLGATVRGLAVTAAGQLRQLPAQTPVHIARASDYNANLAEVVQRQYEHFRARVPLSGKRVVLKPNLVEYHCDKVINTHPQVVAAVIELCRREGAAEVIVAEGPGHWRNVEYLVSASGLGDVLRHHAVPFIDLNHDEPVKLPNLGRLTGLEYLYLAKTVAAADVLISLPKLKTHHWAGATLSLKNLFGTLPGICYGWPKNELHWRGIDNSIVDIALTRTPDLAVVDGIIGMEGDGPLNGTARPLGALIMGADPLAVDATCCRLMQLNPERIAYLVLAHGKKLGLLREQQIQQIGETIASVAQPFATVEHFRGLYVGRPA